MHAYTDRTPLLALASMKLYSINITEKNYGTNNEIAAWKWTINGINNIIIIIIIIIISYLTYSESSEPIQQRIFCKPCTGDSTSIVT